MAFDGDASAIKAAHHIASSPLFKGLAVHLVSPPTTMIRSRKLPVLVVRWGWNPGSGAGRRLPLAGHHLPGITGLTRPSTRVFALGTENPPRSC